ncbi:MAG: MFS transporter [Rubrivivax sp.]|nr:MFS transporter [Rubrivivax sp.]MBK7261544.1 MFS transporter [Rubrivivax sp.]MBK8529392.1 MFS transporter [Rubrivivax sp.]
MAVSQVDPAPAVAVQPRSLAPLLNLAHALDHLFLLIFATAVASIASDFGFARWEDLMPYGAGAFVMFGLGSAPAGRLGDLWGRRRMMLIFFFGIGVSALLAAMARGPWQLSAALTLLGAFSAIYHPVGIPMLLQHSTRPGLTIGWNGLCGNMGIAAAAVTTGLLVSLIGWRAAFVVPGLASIALGLVFARLTPDETEPPSRRTGRAAVPLPTAMLARVFAVMTMAAISAGVLFNFTTNGNGQLLAERMHGLVEDPKTLGLLLAAVYAVASLAQVIVGRLIDRLPLKPLYLSIVLAQIPLLVLAAHAQGWWIFAALLGTMTVIFGAIPFTDAMIVRYVDDRLRSRVAGMRLTVAFGFSSGAVWLLGPLVKANGFATMLLVMAGVSVLSALFVLWLPGETALRKTLLAT